MKRSRRKSRKINGLMLNDLLTYNSYPWIIYIYFFNWLVIIWRQGEGFIWTWASKDKDVERVCRQMDKELGGLENWKIFMDVICVLSLRWKGITTFEKRSILSQIHIYVKFLHKHKCQRILLCLCSKTT